MTATNCNTGAWLSSLLWPTPPTVNNPDHVLERALHELRESHRILEARAADKRRRITEEDMKLAELGLRMRAHGNRLSAADAQTFRRASRHRQRLLESHGQFQSMLANVEGQIDSLEDAPALEHSLGTLAGSVDVRAQRATDAQAALNELRRDMDSLSRTQPRQVDIDAVLDVGSLEVELSDMMASSELDTALERMQRLARAPTVPRSEPTSHADAERELGVAAVLA